MIIHIETPAFTVIDATDLGMVRAASTMCKTWQQDMLTYMHGDDNGRFATIQMKARKETITNE